MFMVAFYLPIYSRASTGASIRLTTSANHFDLLFADTYYVSYSTYKLSGVPQNIGTTSLYLLHLITNGLRRLIFPKFICVEVGSEFCQMYHLLYIEWSSAYPHCVLESQILSSYSQFKSPWETYLFLHVSKAFSILDNTLFNFCI